MRKNMHFLLLATVFVLSIAMAGVGTASPASPVISLEPKDNTTEVGEEFTVDIVVADITEEESLYGWECRITFNPRVINAVNATEGSFLEDTGYETIWLPPNINNTLGTIDTGALLMPSIEWDGFPPNGAVGSGNLATITFKGVGQGSSDLDFKDKEDTELHTVKGEPPNQYDYPIDHTAKGGSFSNAGPSIPLSLIAGVVVVAAVCVVAVFYFRRKRASAGT